jgi:hypothetical protein
MKENQVWLAAHHHLLISCEITINDLSGYSDFFCSKIASVLSADQSLVTSILENHA